MPLIVRKFRNPASSNNLPLSLHRFRLRVRTRVSRNVTVHIKKLLIRRQ
jgi:hypothetical protein